MVTFAKNLHPAGRSVADRATPRVGPPDGRPAQPPSCAVAVPGLIFDNRVSSVLRRGTESAQLLEAMAKPKAYDGPDLQVRGQIMDELDNAFQEFPGLARLPQVYLGSVVLTNLPAADDDLTEWIGARDTEETDFSILATANAFKVTGKAGIGKELAGYTLKVMKTAGQLDYLRKSGFVGPDWTIVVEMHYYRDRPRSNPVLHKDTLGQTLFVNLDYFTADADAGPEFIVNPPPIASHENKISGTLPEEFLEDLAEVKKSLPTPTEIDTVDLQPNQFVAFVDELIHHATPLAKNRRVAGKALLTFLEHDADFKDAYPAAIEAKRVSDEDHTENFHAELKQRSKVTDEQAATWKALMALCSAPTEKTDRPELRKVGLTDAQIDRLLFEHARHKYDWVHIDKKAVQDNQQKIPLRQTDSEEPLQLPRRMSYRQIPPKFAENAKTKRSFLRTWVRAVPSDDVQRNIT